MIQFATQPEPDLTSEEPESEAKTAVVINLTAQALQTEMQTQGQRQIEIANAYVVDSQQAYDEAANRLVEIAKYKSRVVELFRESKDLAHKTHAKICDNERILLKPALEAETIYKNKALEYQLDMQKKQEEIDRENKRQEELRKKNEEIAARAAMITARKTAYTNMVTERIRLATEAAGAQASPEAIIDILRAPLTGLPPIPTGMSPEQTKDLQQFADEQKLRLASAADEHKAPQAELEEMISEPVREEKPAMAPIPRFAGAQALPSVSAPAPKVFTKSNALSPKTKYKAEVFDIRLLCAAIGEGKVSPMYVDPAQGKLNTIANAERDTLNMPGVRAVPDVTMSVNKSRGGS